MRSASRRRPALNQFLAWILRGLLARRVSAKPTVNGVQCCEVNFPVKKLVGIGMLPAAMQDLVIHVRSENCSADQESKFVTWLFVFSATDLAWDTPASVGRRIWHSFVVIMNEVVPSSAWSSPPDFGSDSYCSLHTICGRGVWLFSVINQVLLA